MWWALLYLRWITNNEWLCSAGNSAQLYDSLDGRGNFGTRIHRYIQLSQFIVHLKPRVLLISYTAIKNRFLIQRDCGDCGDARGGPAFLVKKTRSRSQEERNREWGELWNLLFFSKHCIEVWLIFSVTLSSAAQQCDSVIHIKIYILFLILFHGVYHWILNIVIYSLQ